MNADWGNQRVKGLSINAVIRNMLTRKNTNETHVETSLIDRFRYPKYGPGQLWDAAAQQVRQLGGTILTGHHVTAINIDSRRHVHSVTVIDRDGCQQDIPCDYVLSSMPLCDLVPDLRGIDIPADILADATALPYRDFVTVGLLVDSLTIHTRDGKPLPDTLGVGRCVRCSRGRLCCRGSRVCMAFGRRCHGMPDMLWVYGCVCCRG